MDNVDNIAIDLVQLVQGDVFSDIFNRAAFSTDASIYQIMPSCVVAPKSSADIAAVVKYAGSNDFAVCARGAGSGVAGESLTSGIVIDITRHMDQVISISDDGSTVVCEPGVVLDELNRLLLPYGRKIGPDPSSGNRAVLGGIVANNATGAHSLQYGYIADHVEAIEMVLADGTIAEFTNDYNVFADTAIKPAKDVAALLTGKEKIISKALPKTQRNRCGYHINNIVHEGSCDMAKLLTGSEGTLGVFTKIKLKTVEIPSAKALVQFEFDNMDDMAQAVKIIVDTGASACELMDRRLIDMVVTAHPSYCDIFTVERQAVLLVEHTGDDMEAVTQKISKTTRLVGKLAAGSQTFIDKDQQGRIWKSRKDAVPLLYRQKGRKRPTGFIEDVSVVNVNLAKYIAGMEAISEKYDTPMAYYGHAGDGELHIRPFLDLAEAGDVAKMQAIANEVFELAWSLGGTISGEHGDGLVRAGFIKRQYGPEYYELLRKVKDIFDPARIMNPGKVINGDPDIMIKNLRTSEAIDQDRLQTNLLFGKDEFLYEIEQCNGDGVCLSKSGATRMCPVFRAVGGELACSRSKANMLRAWITGVLNDTDIESDEFKEILSLCINCKMCSVDCPSGVDISKLIVEARSEYAKRKGFSAAERALCNNRYMSIMASTFAPISNIVMSNGLFKKLLEKAIGLDSRRDWPSFKWGGFISKGRSWLKTQKIAEPIQRIAYFVDSYANYNDHDLGFAVIKTLTHLGIDVSLPEQRPAPVPAFVYGNLKAARKDLAYNVKHLAKEVRQGKKIICSEPSAAMCLRDEMRLLIDSEDARLVSENTIELMEYINGLKDAGRLSEVQSFTSKTYAYHKPCHMIAMGLKGSAELLGSVANTQLQDIQAGCCGLAGTCGMQKKNYEMSVCIGKDMASAINSSAGEFAVTECGACKMQIEHLTGKKVLHPIKILAKAYGVI